MTVPALRARRSTSRDTNLRRLVAELQIQPLCRDDIRDLFNCSGSHVRNYINLMGDLVKPIIQGGRTQHTYQLTGNERRVAAFLAKLSQPVEPAPPKKAPAKVSAPTRHVHILADDTRFCVRLLRKAPEHTELHQAFWARSA